MEIEQPTDAPCVGLLWIVLGIAVVMLVIDTGVGYSWSVESTAHLSSLGEISKRGGRRGRGVEESHQWPGIGQTREQQWSARLT